MPSQSTHYDAIVIGTGQGGKPLSQALAHAGKRTAVIERSFVGGTCVNVGCTPTKTMVASGRVAYLARRGKDYGVETGKLRISMTKVRQRKRAIVLDFRTKGEKGLKQTKNLDLIFGEAFFTSAHSIGVRLKNGKHLALTADRFFINAGCRPAIPKIAGLEEVPYLDSTSVMELSQVPEHLIVVGGGYEGLEFGQLFRRLGSRVTLVQHGPQLLRSEDSDVAQAVAQILEEDGIAVRLGAAVESVRRVRNKIALKLSAGKKSHTLHGSHLLLTVGRVPNTEALQLAAAGVATDDRGFIRVNDKLETSAKGIYALGDIKGGPAFTHISYDDFRILRTNLLENGDASIANRFVPFTVFMDPQLGRVGSTEAELRKAGRSIRVAKMPMNYVARAVEVDETRGFMKIIVEKESSQILGAAILGLEGGEVMSQIQIAMMGKLPYTALQNGTFAHPLLAESLNNVFSHFQD